MFVTDYPHDGAALLPHAPPRGSVSDQAASTCSGGASSSRPAPSASTATSSCWRRPRQGVEVDSIQYYLDFFRFGAPPHGGLGFGLTRLLMQMLDQENVREVTFLYRGPHRLEP